MATEPAIPWRMRPDLVVRADSTDRWVLKDPVNLRYTLLSRAEFAGLQRLDGTATVADLTTRLSADRRSSEAIVLDPVSALDVADLLSQFRQNQLIVPTRPIPMHEFTRARDTLERTDLHSLRTAMSRGAGMMLSTRMRVFDPTRLLDWCDPVSRQLFSRRGFVVWFAVVALAVTILILRFGRFVAELPHPSEFATADRGLALLLVFIVVKLLHEFGHAAAARRFGADCHEAGVMVLLLTPVPYTNVSDTWMIDRRQRMIVSAAGVFVELGVAAACLILWSFSAPGFGASMLASTALLCSATTFLFNANPLVRFDGYFLLADLWERPNLGQQAAGRVQSWLERMLLGADETSNPQIPASDPALLIYGLLSAAYRISLTLAIASLLVALLGSWQLRSVGLLVALMAAGPMLLRPMLTATSGIVVAFFHRKNRGAATIRLLLVLSGVITLLFLPIPRSIVAPGVVEPSGEAVFCPRTATLTSFVPYRSELLASAVLAQFQDDQLMQELDRAASDVARRELRVRLLELRRDPGGQAQLPEAREALSASQIHHAQLAADSDRMIVIAPGDGLLLPPRGVAEKSDDDELAAWSGVPLSERNVEATLDAGTVIGFVSHRQRREVVLWLDDDSVTQLHPGMPAEFQASGSPGTILTGTIEAISQTTTDVLPEELLAAELLPPIHRPQQHAGLRSARLVIDAPADIPLPPVYATGLVRVRVQSESLLARFHRFVRETF